MGKEYVPCELCKKDHEANATCPHDLRYIKYCLELNLWPNPASAIDAWVVFHIENQGKEVNADSKYAMLSELLVKLFVK